MADRLTAEEVRAVRAALGWSTYRMAQELGCNQSTVWRMENGGNISGPASKLLKGLISEFTASSAAGAFTVCCTQDGSWIALDPATGMAASGRTLVEAVAELRRLLSAKKVAA